MNNNIGVEINQTDLFGMVDPIFEFTFLPDPIEDVEERMDTMTDVIRRTLRQYYNMTGQEDAIWAVEFRPAGDDRFQRQRTFGHINTMEGHIFSEIFNGLLQSDETLQLNGMMISVQRLGSEMRSQYYGRGLTVGHKSIPTGLKKQGLIAHPVEYLHSERLNEVGLCGIRACLLLKEPRFQKAGTIYEWMHEAERLGTLLNITKDGGMEKPQFDQLVQQEGWTKYRIIVFSLNRPMLHSSAGPDW